MKKLKEKTRCIVMQFYFYKNDIIAFFKRLKEKKDTLFIKAIVRKPKIEANIQTSTQIHIETRQRSTNRKR